MSLVRRGLVLLFAMVAATASAQSRPEYVQFAPAAVKGVLYRPDAGPAPHVGVLIMHRTSNFLAHLGTTELARRGFLVLAMNSRFDNNEAAVRWEEIALDVKTGVEFLRMQRGITRVVLFGHSGGGPTMSFYQAVAERGVAYCQAPNKLSKCSDELAGLPPANGIVFVDAHPGTSVNALRSLNPAVLDEADPRRIDPRLDPFNPANGYHPRGASQYTAAFRERYFKAQAARMNRLIEDAQRRLARMEAGQAPYRDDDLVVIPRGEGARLLELDPWIHHTTTSPQKLLRNDGSISEAPIESMRPPGGLTEAANASFEATRVLTLRSFLSANAIRSVDSMYAVDWCSSNNSVVCAVRSISVPVLFAAMGAHYFIRDNELHYEMAASADKDFIVVEGATHGIRPCTSCEHRPGEYSNSVRNFFDYVERWINERF